MSGKILVLTAIDDELDKARAPEGVEVIYSGVGKVNAIQCLEFLTEILLKRGLVTDVVAVGVFKLLQLLN